MKFLSSLIGNIPQDVAMDMLTKSLMPHFRDGTVKFIAIEKGRDNEKIEFNVYTDKVIIEESEYEYLKNIARNYFKNTPK